MLMACHGPPGGGQSDDHAADTGCDSAGASSWYADADGDGYGEGASVLTACEPPEGLVAESGDCDDEDGDLNPGAEEVCGDGIDQDCTGADSVCGVYTLDDATIVVEAVPSALIEWPDTVGELSADGSADLFVQAYVERERDEVQLVSLEEGVRTTQDVFAAFQVAAAPYWPALNVGYGSVGDRNGDGIDEVAVSYARASTLADNDGAIYVWESPHDGTRLADSSNAWFGSGEDVELRLGAGVLFDPELCPTAGSGLWLTEYAGVSGEYAKSLLVCSDAPFGVAADLAATVLVNDDDSGYPGHGYGDVDGDGLSDLLLVNTGYSTGGFCDDYSGCEGQVSLALGPLPAGLAYASSLVGPRWTGEAHEYAGNDAAFLGDVSGDGYDDVAVATRPYYNSTDSALPGAVYLLAGTSTSGALADVAFAVLHQLEVPRGYERALDVEGAGDLDGDSLADILVVDPWSNTADGYTGAGLVLSSPFTGSYDLSTELAITSFIGTSTSMLSAASLGDLNSDGVADLSIVVGGNRIDAPFADGAFLGFLGPFEVVAD